LIILFNINQQEKIQRDKRERILDAKRYSGTILLASSLIDLKLERGT